MISATVIEVHHLKFGKAISLPEEAHVANWTTWLGLGPFSGSAYSAILLKFVSMHACASLGQSVHRN